MRTAIAEMIPKKQGKHAHHNKLIRQPFANSTDSGLYRTAYNPNLTFFQGGLIYYGAKSR